MRLPERRASFLAAREASASSEKKPELVCGPCGVMEVVEAAAQLQTLKFGGLESAASPPPEERRDAEPEERAGPAREQPPPAPDAGGNPPPPSETCVAGPDAAAEPPTVLQASDSSDSDSDRSSACGSRGTRVEGTRGLGSGERARALRGGAADALVHVLSGSWYPDLAALLSHGPSSLVGVPSSFPNLIVRKVTSEGCNLFTV